MKPQIKIRFVDFWSGFVENDNYFYNLLATYYEIELSDTPDILFYSSFGRKYLSYHCVRIFYTGENVRPDFTGCDYAISFDYNSNAKHFRLPLFPLYVEELSTLQLPISKEAALTAWRKKSNFCCMVVSNPLSKKRIDFFKYLSTKRRVDSGGRYLNNIGLPVESKLDFIKNYKFVISFENAAYPGYTTEKIVEPFMVNSIPIYWGDPLVHQEFDERTFINVRNYKNYSHVFEQMLAIEANEALALSYLMPAKLISQQPYTSKQQIFVFLQQIITNLKNHQPVASSAKSLIHPISSYLNNKHQSWTKFRAKNGLFF